MSRKNPHGIRSRVVNNVVEIWLGEPGDAESDCIAQFHMDYMESVLFVMQNIERAPKSSGRHIHYGVRK